MNTLSEYQVLLNKSLKKLPESKQIEFGKNIVQRLYDEYHPALSRDGFQKEANLAKETINLLSEVGSQPERRSSAVLENYQTRLYKGGYVINSELDLSQVYQFGRDQLFNALQYCIAFLLEKKIKHLIGCAFCPLEVVKLQLVKEGVDLSDQDMYINDPLFQKEILFQLSMVSNKV